MRRLTAVIAAAIVLPVLAEAPKEADRIARFEKEVAAIEKRQADNPPKPDSVVFAGSSTVRLWDLTRSFPGMKTVNSGFGGSEIRDVTHFADRLIFKHKPDMIIVYAGDNDLNSGRTPDQVLADFKAFVEVAHAKSPETPVWFISIKPSPARWTQYDTQTKANALVKALCAKDDWLGYIDVVPLMLGEDGKPRKELYAKDGLHLSPAGYEAVSRLVLETVD
jgi:lysophospholipase L1-like esterase